MNELLNNPEFQKLLPYLPWIALIALIQLIILLLLANAIKNVLLLMKEQNRLLSPYQPFLMAVPLFNIYWNFVVVRNLRDSIINECYDRKLPIDENPTQNEGYIFSWSFLVGNLPLPFISYIASFTYIIGIVVYWKKVLEYKKLLEKDVFDFEKNS